MKREVHRGLKLGEELLLRLPLDTRRLPHKYGRRETWGWASLEGMPPSWSTTSILFFEP